MVSAEDTDFIDEKMGYFELKGRFCGGDDVVFFSGPSPGSQGFYLGGMSIFVSNLQGMSQLCGKPNHKPSPLKLYQPNP